jgi:hypothetical protein
MPTSTELTLSDGVPGVAVRAVNSTRGELRWPTGRGRGKGSGMPRRVGCSPQPAHSLIFHGQSPQFRASCFEPPSSRARAREQRRRRRPRWQCGWWSQASRGRKHGTWASFALPVLHLGVSEESRFQILRINRCDLPCRRYPEGDRQDHRRANAAIGNE